MVCTYEGDAQENFYVRAFINAIPYFLFFFTLLFAFIRAHPQLPAAQIATNPAIITFSRLSLSPVFGIPPYAFPCELSGAMTVPTKDMGDPLSEESQVIDKSRIESVTFCPHTV